jgi:hypothetical protein
MKTLQRDRKVCPRCRHSDSRPARRTLLEYFPMLFLFRPYRCLDCGNRFWGFV